MTTGFSGRQYKNDLNLLCQHCDSRFTNDRFRLFCTHQCKVDYYKNLGKHLWGEDEEALISSYIGLYPTAVIVRKVKPKLKDVSTNRIKIKVEELARKQDKYIGDRVENLNIAGWSKMLGVCSLRVHRWVKKGLLSRRSGKEHMITYGSMRKYAVANPSDFHGVTREVLEKLFPSPRHKKLIDPILEAKPCKAPVKAIRCTTLDRTYPTLTACAKEFGTARDTIKRSIESGIPAVVGKQYLSFTWA